MSCRPNFNRTQSRDAKTIGHQTCKKKKKKNVVMNSPEKLKFTSLIISSGTAAVAIEWFLIMKVLSIQLQCLLSALSLCIKHGC